MTSSKEAGAVMEIDGKKVALGVPGPNRPTSQDDKAFPFIPLRRGGSPDEAAAAMLLCV